MDRPEFDAYLQDLWRQQLKAARKSMAFKILTARKYRDPRGYMAFEKVALLIAAQTLHDASGLELADFAQRKASGISACLAQSAAPIWWLGQELGFALLRSQCPPASILLSGRRTYPYGIIMLPSSFLINPDGNVIDFIAWQWMLPGEVCRARLADGSTMDVGSTDADCDTLHLLAMGQAGTTYALGFGPEPSSNDNFHLSSYYENPDMDAERIFTSSIRSVAIQSILLLSSREELVSGNGSHGSLKSPSNSKKLSDPRWLGRFYKSQRTRHSKGGSHASPVLHWRAGHWRQQPVGEGRRHRKTIWVEPTVVGDADA